MTEQHTSTYVFVSGMTAYEIEREARALQARAIADMVRSLRRAIAARLHRGPATQSA